MNREERRAMERAQNKARGIPADAQRVGTRLPGVSLTPEQRQMPLDRQVETILAAAEAASEPLPEQAGHVPAIGALVSPEGAWGVHCLRCTADAKMYVYPCKINPRGWPPQVLVAYEPPVAE